MAEYIDNGVQAVGVGDQIGIAVLHTDETTAICAGIVFKKSGVYRVTLKGNFTFVDYLGSNDSTCVGCRYNPGLNIPSNTCMTCSRRCADHYERENDNE